MLVSSCDPGIAAPAPSWKIIQYLKCTSRKKSKETVFDVFIDCPAHWSANLRVKCEPVKVIQPIKATWGTVMMAPTALVHINSENKNERIMNMLLNTPFLYFILKCIAAPSESLRSAI